MRMFQKVDLFFQLGKKEKCSVTKCRKGLFLKVGQVSANPNLLYYIQIFKARTSYYISSLNDD